MEKLSLEHNEPYPATTGNRANLSWADRLLGIFTKVNPGEAAGAFLLAMNVFLLLALYYLLKTVREALILSESGAEVKSYSSAGQAVLMLLLVPAYGMLASRIPRFKLIAFTTTFFALNLILFAVLGLSGMKIGVPFFLWIGIFNLFIVAQFWALANDVYTENQGKRLFPFIGAGASLGAIFGAQIAEDMFKSVGAYWVMVISAIALIASLVLTWLASRRADTSDVKNRKEAEPLSSEGGFKLIFSNRYL
ncbi:MAG TPA: MFS transporter, partial [Blastocatellia bacterium]|nr:MFS transporter [Blastocatellia bacterium]